MMLLHIDLETDGLDHHQDAVLAVGAVTFDTVSQEVIETHYGLVHTDMNKESSNAAEARAINRISHEATTAARQSQPVMNWLAHMMYEADVIVGWNPDFDLRFLMRHPLLGRILTSWYPSLCLKSWLREKHGITEHHLADIPDDWYKGLCWDKGSTPTFPLLPDGKAWKHNALFDAMRVMQTGMAFGLYRVDQWRELAKAIQPRAFLQNQHRIQKDASAYRVTEDFGKDGALLTLAWNKAMTPFLLKMTYEEECAFEASLSGSVEATETPDNLDTPSDS